MIVATKYCERYHRWFCQTHFGDQRRGFGSLRDLKQKRRGGRLRRLIRSAEVKLGFVEVVDLCSQDEIALRQAVDLVRPDGDLDFSPSKEDVWVVPLLLRKFAYAICELEGFAKVGKLEGLRDVVFFDDVPAVHLISEGGKLLTLERRYFSSARDACFGR
jgi:hypothetical protein